MEYSPTTLTKKKVSKYSTFIYIISNNNNAIKIGHSRNPFKRLKQLQTGNNNKLHLLLTAEADIYLERRLHRMFFLHKQCGEWFTVDKELLDTIINYLIDRYPTTQYDL